MITVTYAEILSLRHIYEHDAWVSAYTGEVVGRKNGMLRTTKFGRHNHKNG